MLSEQSHEDQLTALGNRLRLREDLEILRRGRAERYGHSYAAVLRDVDHFKAYNDRCGHLAGDGTLRRVAGDAAYRYGGEEFLVVLPGQSVDAAAIADRVRQAVEDLGLPRATNAPRGVVTISAGVAALYDAKEAGRNSARTRGGDERKILHGLDRES